MEAKISVVIPVYNVEKYLRDCSMGGIYKEHEDEILKTILSHFF